MILVAVEDMFFASKIRTTAEHLNAQLKFVRSAEEAAACIDGESTILVIADLQSTKIDVFDLVMKLKSDSRFADARFVGFYSHVFTEFKQRGLDAGFDEVMPRSAFSKNLADIIAGS